MAPDGRTALTLTRERGGSWLWAVPPSAPPHRLRKLAPDVLPETLLVARTSRQALIVGNRGRRPILQIVPLRGRGPIASVPLATRDRRRDWAVLAAALSPDERWLAVAYHSIDADGLDWFDLSRPAAPRCPGVARSPRGCIRSHGVVASVGNAFVTSVSDGGPVFEVDHTGATLRTWDAALGRNHMLAVGADGSGQIVAAGSCDYVGGAAVLSPDGAVTLVPGARTRVCAMRISTSSDGLAALVGRHLLASGSHTDVPLVDVATAQVVRTLRLPLAAADVLLAPDARARLVG